jgi:hypothetical protein
MGKAVIFVSKRLQPVALAFLCLIAVHLVSAILSGGEPASVGAVRVAIAGVSD